MAVRMWYKQPRVYAQAVVSGCGQNTKQMASEPEEAGVQSCWCRGQIREIQLSEVGTWGEVEVIAGELTSNGVGGGVLDPVTGANSREARGDHRDDHNQEEWEW